MYPKAPTHRSEAWLRAVAGLPCTACAHYRAARCHNAKAAQLSSINSVIEVGTTLAAMPQHCNGHKQKGQK